jgi:anti-sigma factor RsiW
MTRAEIEALLPFLANGTLAGEERAKVEAALDADPELRAEYAALVAIRSGMRAEEPGYSPGEIGLARLMRSIGEEGAGTPPAQSALPPARSASPGLWRIAAAVLLAVVLAQGAFLLRDGGAPGYELAGEDRAALLAAVHPDTTEAALRAALLEAGVEIVGGPSALGLYALAPVDSAVLAGDARAALLSTGVFESVEVTAAE